MSFCLACDKEKIDNSSEASIVAEWSVFDGVIQEKQFILLFFVFASIRRDI